MVHYFASIQALRAIAALSVSCVHFNILCLWLMGRPADSPLVSSLASGVDLFFVISGFIMVMSSEGLFNKPGASFLFVSRRVARIVPIYWATTITSIVVFSSPWSPETLVKSLLFLPFLTPDGYAVPVYGVGWTLNFEMFFYMAFAGALLLRRDHGVLVLSGLMVFFVTLGQSVELPVPLSVWADPIVLEFVMGMLLALAYRRGVRLPIWVCISLVIAGAVAVWFSQAGGIPTGLRWLKWGTPAWLIMIGATLVRRPWPVPRFLIVLGDASYSIYLVHSLVLDALWLAWLAGMISHSTPVWLLAVGGEVLTILISVATYHCFEKPMARCVTTSLKAPNAFAAARACRTA